MDKVKQQKNYLEIYPSEVAARKISKHLDKMAEKRPRVYRKTLLRYKKLAYLLIECVTKIVRMLQSEMLLSSDDAEFQELVSEFDTEQIDELRNSVDDLGNLVDKQPSGESRRIAADALRQYKEVFNQAANTDFGYIEVNECAQMLNYWMSRRFSGFNPNFKFQIKQLPIWATFVIIAYGKYHAVGETTKFITEFKQWCDDLDEDTSNCWALPYNIFNMTKVIDSSNFTVDALVIYDLLINGCLYQLIDGKAKVPMDSFYIANLIKSHCPDKARTVRTRYTKQAELIESLAFHSTDVAEVDE
jgi:hypothetical protein